MGRSVVWRRCACGVEQNSAGVAGRVTYKDAACPVEICTDRTLARLALQPLCRTRSASRISAPMLARQPAVAERAREHLIASPFGTIHAAMFSMPRPVGTAIPHSADLRAGEFRPVRHHRLDRLRSRSAIDGAAAIPDCQPQDQAPTWRCLAPREPLPPLPPVLRSSRCPDRSASKRRAKGPLRSLFAIRIPDAARAKHATPDVELPYADIPPANLTRRAQRRSEGAAVSFRRRSDRAGTGRPSRLGRPAKRRW